MGNSVVSPKKCTPHPNLKEKLIRMRKSKRVIQLKKKIYDGKIFAKWIPRLNYITYLSFDLNVTF